MLIIYDRIAHVMSIFAVHITAVYRQITKILEALLNIVLYLKMIIQNLNAKQFEPQHEISNNVVCATSKASDHPALRAV